MMKSKDCVNGNKQWYMACKGLSPITIFEHSKGFTLKFPYIRNGQPTNGEWSYSLGVKNNRLNIYEHRKRDGRLIFFANVSPNAYRLNTLINSCINSRFYGEAHSNIATDPLAFGKAKAKHKHLKRWLITKLNERGINIKVKDVNNIRYDEIFKHGCYPILNHIYNHCGHSHPYIVDILGRRKARKVTNVKEITKHIFKSTNKRLVKEVAKSFNKPLSELCILGNILGDVLPIDYYKDFENIGMRTSDLMLNDSVADKERIRNLLSQYNPRRRLTLIESMNNFWELTDSANQWSIRNLRLPESPRTMRELHDYITLQYRRQSRIYEVNFELPINERFSTIKDVIIPSSTGDLQVVFPSSSDELSDWSDMMNNCVRSYAQRVYNKECIIMGIKQSKKLKYCIEIRNNQIVQFLGKHNTQPIKEDYDTIIEYLKNKKLISNINRHEIFEIGRQEPINVVPLAHEINEQFEVNTEEELQPYYLQPNQTENNETADIVGRP